MSPEGIDGMKPRQLELELKGGAPLVLRLVKGTRDDPLIVRFDEGTKVTMFRRGDSAVQTDDFSWFDRLWQWMAGQAFGVVKGALWNALRMLRIKYSI